MSYVKNICKGLSVSQVLALHHISKGENTFITGSPGCGKSHLIKTIQKFLFYKRKRVLVTSSTAASGNVIDAPTAHSQFGLGIGNQGLAKCIENMEKWGIINKLALIEVIIIDEISMIKNDYFELVDRLFR